MCWVTVPATRPVCCVENSARYSTLKKTPKALGDPAPTGSSKETKALEAEGIVDIA